ncbi:hypothetical protein SG34_009205 [Thalassomonas viridans]|uniref:Uncharacterized protein n=1 Tax=Thalassomonas viridans TaxID=137584 RepID=A0AAE9Z693_9GAMM|nr:hypothetical protein [Thalassomonas viridans]WDE07042.1 hypothetical protein SG34_009205 [Thalassomonas viridans]
MVLFSWFIHAKKSLNDIQAQKNLQTAKQKELSYAQQAMWPIAKPREQTITLSANVIPVKNYRNKKPATRLFRYKQIFK